MKRITTTFTLILFILSITSLTYAQLTPQASSGQTIIQDFGLGKVTLTYSRPNVKGREVFGSLEPYGAVWRTGANAATTITFTDDVTVAGNKVPAGKYSLFTIPAKDEWVVILNKTADQWGAYDYKSEQDLLRFSVKPSTIKPATETFMMQFADVKPGSMQLNLSWENTSISIPMTVNFDAKVMANIDNAMAGEKKPYFAAAQYYYENDKDLSKALAWMNLVEQTDVKAPWYKLWKARILLKMGNKPAAIETANAGIAAAKEANNEEYVRLNEGVIAQAKK
ncbi:MAG: DUF2911 domain-containing protein [Pelobium sp.]